MQKLKHIRLFGCHLRVIFSLAILVFLLCGKSHAFVYSFTLSGGVGTSDPSIYLGSNITTYLGFDHYPVPETGESEDNYFGYSGSTLIISQNGQLFVHLKDYDASIFNSWSRILTNGLLDIMFCTAMSDKTMSGGGSGSIESYLLYGTFREATIQSGFFDLHGSRITDIILDISSSYASDFSSETPWYGILSTVKVDVYADGEPIPNSNASPVPLPGTFLILAGGLLSVAKLRYRSRSLINKI